MSNEDIMLDAILRSGVKVEPGKRYTLAEVWAIYCGRSERGMAKSGGPDAPLPHEIVGALLDKPVSRATVYAIEAEAIEKIKEAVGGAA